MKFSSFRFSALVSCMAMPALAFSQTFLPDTVITASRVMQRAQDALPDVSLITRSDIERSQAKDVPSLLVQLAGMEVTQSGCNPLLRPEQARSQELGMQYTKDTWNARITAFENRLHWQQIAEKDTKDR